MTEIPSNSKIEEPDDFWDLGDDDLDVGSSPPKEPAAPVKAPAPMAQKPATPPASAEKHDASTTPSFPKPSPQEPVSKPAPEKIRVKEQSKNDPRPTSLFEKAAISTVVLCLLGTAVWGVMAFIEEAPNGEIIELFNDFPIKGENVTVTSVETWWREPIRSGENTDSSVVVDARLIPCAKIEISDSGNATLQASFRDSENNLIGDIINLNIEGGKFAKSGSSEISVHATAGFVDASLINAYVNGDFLPWTIVIVEGDKTETPLVKALVEANRKEN